MSKKIPGGINRKGGKEKKGNRKTLAIIKKRVKGGGGGVTTTWNTKRTGQRCNYADRGGQKKEGRPGL